MNNSKKLVRSAINYVELYNRCPKEQLPKLKKFHQQHRDYLEKINSLPEELPSINWEYYKQNVRPDYLCVVENFEKIYKNFEIPYPEDKYSMKIDEMIKELKEEIRKYCNESNERIKAYEKEIERIKSHPPFEEMTMEEYIDWYPDDGPDFINRPTFWPHTPEEQINNEIDKNQEEKGASDWRPPLTSERAHLNLKDPKNQQNSKK